MIPRYARPEMAAIWEPQTRFQIWLDIEAAAMDAMAELGTIPAEAARAYRAKARFEIDRTDAEGRLKFNPLASWSPEDIEGYMALHDLPRHPLVEQGYPSIGCAPCTSRVARGEDPRSGRWKGWDKVECGIHVPGSPDSSKTGGELPPGYDPAF